MLAQFIPEAVGLQTAGCIGKEGQPCLGDIRLEMHVRRHAEGIDGRLVQAATIATQSQVQIDAGMNTDAVTFVSVVRLDMYTVLGRDNGGTSIETILHIRCEANVVRTSGPLEHHSRMHLMLLQHTRNIESLIRHLRTI